MPCADLGDVCGGFGFWLKAVSSDWCLVFRHWLVLFEEMSRVASLALRSVSRPYAMSVSIKARSGVFFWFEGSLVVVSFEVDEIWEPLSLVSASLCIDALCNFSANGSSVPRR